MDVFEIVAIFAAGLIPGFFVGYFTGWEVCLDFVRSLNNDEKEPTDESTLHLQE